MTVEFLAAGLLIILLLASNLFWAVLVNRLLNKLMSRSYAEYEQAQALRIPKAPEHPSVDDVDHDADRQAREINSILGVV